MPHQPSEDQSHQQVGTEKHPLQLGVIRLLVARIYLNERHIDAPTLYAVHIFRLKMAPEFLVICHRVGSNLVICHRVGSNLVICHRVGSK